MTTEAQQSQIRLDPPAEGPLPNAPLLPLSHLVPFAWWKYLLAAVAVMTAVCGLRYAAWKFEAIRQQAGPGIARLFDSQELPLERSVSALFLLVAAQLAALIAWGRARSSRDFSGRYRVWFRISACCAFFSLVIATSAHTAWVETIVFFFPREVWRRETVLWLVPVALLAASCGSSLRWEIARSRVNLCLLFLTAAMYTLAAVCQLEVDSLLSPQIRIECTASLLLLGHVTLVFCFWLHARFVLYFCADPVELPRRSPRKPFFLFRTVRSASSSIATDEDIESGDGEGNPSAAGSSMRSNRGGKRRSRKVRVTPRRELRVDSSQHPDSRDAESAAAKPVAKEVRDEDSDQDQRVNPNEALSEQKAGIPRGVDGAPVTGDAPAAPQFPPEWEMESGGSGRVTPPPDPKAGGSPDTEPVEVPEPEPFVSSDPPHEMESERYEDDASEASPEVNLKGLSKKQRRKMQQQLRERERQMHKR